MDFKPEKYDGPNRGCHAILRDEENMYGRGMCPLRFQCFRHKMHEHRPRPEMWRAMSRAPYDPETEECPKYWKI